jgi:hypothetical protein
MNVRARNLLIAGGAIAAAGLWWMARSDDPTDRDQATYPPLDTPKPVAEDIWIIDSGPISAMGLQLPVRMTIIRLASGDLVLHSPTEFSPAVAAAVAALGTVRHLVAPNVAHWTFLTEWQRAFPETTVWAAPGLGDRPQVRASGLRIDAVLGDEAPPAWADEITQGVVAGGAGFHEIWFFHRSSRTLLLVDLIENLEPAKLPPLARLVMRASAATNGTTARYLRPIVRLGGPKAKQAIRELIAVAPERVIFAHGRFFDRQAAEQLQRAFDWLV